MLIAWQALNKLANPQDARFSDAFLVVTPGHHDPRPAARAAARTTRATTTAQRDLVPPDLLERLGQARRSSSPTSTPSCCARRGDAAQADQADPRRRARPSPFTETPDRDGAPRLPRARHARSNIVVINDEAHHCYRRQAGRRRTRRRSTATSEREADEARRGGAGLAHGPRGGPAQDRRQGASTTCRPRRSSCAAPATRKGRSSRGWSPTSR